MSTKELLYIEDALGHAQFLQSQCQDAVNQLQDPQLKSQAQQLVDKNKQIFDKFYSLV
jgi:predicted secreted protein